MFSQVGVPELLIILFVVLLLFGTKRLPNLGRQLGGGLREFKDAITGKDSGDDEPAAEADDKPASPERRALPAPRVDAEAEAADEQPVAEATSERG
jgi:sec-independent protein translocase protein TatA